MLPNHRASHGEKIRYLVRQSRHERPQYCMQEMISWLENSFIYYIYFLGFKELWKSAMKSWDRYEIWPWLSHFQEYNLCDFQVSHCFFLHLHSFPCWRTTFKLISHPSFQSICLAEFVPPYKPWTVFCNIKISFSFYKKITQIQQKENFLQNRKFWNTWLFEKQVSI